jgi:phenylacetate-coenzyme A ligase PaaK-like adenylate-forming protein
MQAANLSGPARIDISILCEEPDLYLTIAVGSGSTGEPKLLPVTHEQICGRINNYCFPVVIFHLQFQGIILNWVGHIHLTTAGP